MWKLGYTHSTYPPGVTLISRHVSALLPEPNSIRSLPLRYRIGLTFIEMLEYAPGTDKKKGGVLASRPAFPVSHF